MSKEFDDIEFDELLADKRHKEISVTLKGIAALLNKAPDKSVSDAIEKLVGKLGELKMPEVKIPDLKTPDVKVEVNQDKVVTSVEQLSKDLLVELKKFNERPIATEFNVGYNYGNVTTVKIQYTAADKLTYKK